jgi:hypothetical protein
MTNKRQSPEAAVSDYLWDRSGEVDPEIVRLESMLGSFKHDRRPQRQVARRFASSSALRAAAVLAFAIVGVWIVAALQHSGRGERSTWEVIALQGSPKIGSQSLTSNSRLQLGQWLETDRNSQARVSDSSIGHVTIEPQSRVRVVQSNQTEHRLELARGKIEAFIIAPPRLFFVETPAATAVDLGCHYNLSVENDGSGLLEVTLGWVSFERGGQESIVPRGAMCKTRKGVGPGTPYYADASPRLQRELERFDFGGGGEKSLEAVLKEAGSHDDLTLWHLLARVQSADRGRIFDRLASLVPPPNGVSRQSIVGGDVDAMKRWRDAFMWAPMPQKLPRLDHD